MTEVDEPQNPFDFRTPVRAAKDLVGRQGPLRWYADSLKKLATRRPEHGLVIGPSGYGKTSLLNGYAEEAAGAGALAVRFRPSDSTVSSGEAFFEALLTAAMLSLETTRKFDGDPRFLNWLAQVGRAEPGPSHPTLISHAQPFVDAATIIRDCRQISALSADAGLETGVVLLMDEADSLRDDQIVLETLAALLEGLEDWMFVVAGKPQLLDDLAEAGPSLLKSLQPLPLQPILGVFGVSEMIQGPLSTELREKVNFHLSDFIDLGYATAGSPRLLKLLGHRMWNEARMKDFESFGLSTTALQSFIRARRLEFPAADLPERLEAAIDFVAAASDVPKQDLADLLPIAGMEEFTLQEAALAVLARDGIEDDVDARAEELAAGLEGVLDRLEQAGIVDIEGDSFKIAAAPFGRAYLHQLIFERLDVRVDSPAPSYGTSAGIRFFESMCSSCGFATVGETVVLSRFAANVDADVDEKTALTALAEAIHAEDPLALEESEVVSLAWETLPPSIERDRILLVGVRLGVGLDSTMSIELEVVEVGTLFWADRSLAVEDARAAVDEWFTRHADVLASYRLAFRSAVVEIASSELSDQMVAVAAPFSVIERTLKYYANDDVAAALKYLQGVVAALEAAYAKSSTPYLRAALSDAYQRLGFLAALLGSNDVLEIALRRSAQLRESRDWIDAYNSAYLRALRQEYAAAADLVREAERYIPESTRAWMLLYFAPAPGWSNSDANYKVASIDRPEAASFLRTQALVYDALAGKYNPHEFLKEVDELDALSASQRRLIGWTLFAKYGLVGEAEAQFRAAAAAGDPFAGAEADFVAGQKS